MAQCLCVLRPILLDFDVEGNADIPVLFSLSLLLLLAFGFWEYFVKVKTRSTPLIDLGIFKQHNGLVVALLFYTMSANSAINVSESLLPGMPSSSPY